jgi:acetyl esterase/lipase
MPMVLRIAVSLSVLVGLAGVAAGQPTSRAVAADASCTALDAFLGDASFTTQVVFSGSAAAVRQVESLRAANPQQTREPYLAVTTDGTLLALRNYAGLLRRSVDGGRTFEPAVAVPFGVYDSSFIVDDTTGDVLVLRLWDSSDRAWRSRDQGRTWVEEAITVRPNSVMRRLADEGALRGTRDPGSGRYFLHANATESGITLRHGPWAGRLIVAATFRPHAKEHPSDRAPADATCSCAVFSDDAGRTWTVSEPFPEAYTEENALVELHDGRLYYNSRCCDGFFDKARARPLPPEASLRRTAWSDDGGATWRDLEINRVLPDGGGYSRGYGLKAGLVRLPLADRDVLLYSNTDTAGGKREKLTVWASFDGGRTWPVKRLVRAGPAAYSCLAAGRPGTADAGKIFLLFEGADSGVYDAMQLATFNLAWVLAGDRTGDGAVPAWVAAADLRSLPPDRILETLDLEAPGLEAAQRAARAGDRLGALAALRDQFRVRHPLPEPPPVVDPEVLADAERITRRIFQWGPYEPAAYGEPMDWAADPRGDIEWVAAMHRFHWAAPLADAYRATRDEKYAAAFVALATDWIARHPLERRDVTHPIYAHWRGYPWLDIQTGIRSDRICAAIPALVHAAAFSPEFLGVLLASLHDHQVKTEREPMGQVHNKAIFEQRGFSHVAAFVPEFRDSARWMALCLERSRESLLAQTTEDGVQREWCFGYHGGVLADALAIMERAEAAGLAVPADYRDRLRLMTDYVFAMATPRLGGPMFGDAARQENESADRSRWPLHRRLIAASDFFGDPKYAALAAGDVGRLPAEASFTFPAAGTSVLRDGWGPEQIALWLHCPPAGIRGHDSADNGTFELFAFGRWLMPDSGFYTYGHDPVGRAWHRRTSVHQTLTLDGKDAAIDGRQRLWQTLPDGSVVVTVENPSYPGLVHRRTVWFVDRRFFVLLDEAIGSAAGDLDLHFQLAAGPAMIDSAAHRATTGFADANVLVWQDPRAPVSLHEEEGWHAWKYGHRERRPAFRFRRAGSAPAAFLTVVHPFRGTRRPDVSAALAAGFEVGADRVECAVSADGDAWRIGRCLTTGAAWCRADAPAAPAGGTAATPDRHVPAAAEESRLVDVPYGPHPRQVLHFWRAPAERPTPLVFFVHGGGWVGGHRLTTIGEFLPDLLAAGLSVVSVEYRFVTAAIEAGVDPPVRWPLEDAARALQFVRSKAAAWNIDPARIGGAGTSAGGCTVLWLAYHDDMADPAAADPVARESTRLQCVATLGAQTTLDPAQMREWTPNSRYGGHAFGFMDPRDRATRDLRFDEFLAARERLVPAIERYSPFAHVSADDPPTYLCYSVRPAVGQPAADPTHTANFGVKLRERLEEVGVPCELHHPDEPGKHATIWDYLIDVLPRSNATARPPEDPVP